MENTPNAENLQEIEEKKLENKILTTIVIIATCLAISSLFGNNAGDVVIIFKNKANNQWAYFQAKSIKQSNYKINKEILSLDTLKDKDSPLHKTILKKTILNFDSLISVYEVEKGTIKKEAESYDQISEFANAQADVFDKAEIFYQIAIAIGAIALVIKNRKFWILTMFLGTLGIVISIYAYSLAL